jgi:hypothetical protein
MAHLLYYFYQRRLVVFYTLLSQNIFHPLEKLQGHQRLFFSSKGEIYNRTSRMDSLDDSRLVIAGKYERTVGGPSGEETYLYTNAVLRAAFASRAPKKAIIIAGGVANFTDVKKTFTGIIRSLKENLDPLHEHGFKVFVRRGGPNEVEGLAMIEKFLKDNNLFGSVHGSDAVLTTVIHEALEAVDA